MLRAGLIVPIENWFWTLDPEFILPQMKPEPLVQP